ncbi:hypothetical protein JCM8097_000162 [Rhodosporidiobolus ruineniae]
MPSATTQAAERLSQVQQQLAHSSPPRPDNSSRFRPALPACLPVSYTPLNPLSFLLKAASIRPSHPALVYHHPHLDRAFEWSYSAWATRVKDLAYALLSTGLKAGDRVLVLGPNVPFVADALQAIPAAGGTIVAVNTRLSASEIGYIYEHSSPTVVLVDRELVGLLPKEAVEGGDEKKVRVVQCADTYDGEDPYERFLAEGRREDERRGGKGWAGLEMQRDENATWAISYTSGTTSRPKGVETSYRGTYLAAIANAVESRLNDSSRYLMTLPMFHCLAWCFPYASTMAMCTQICLRTVDIDEVWRGFLERGVTHYCAAPTVQIAVTSHAKARKLDKPVLATIAGAAPTATLIEQLEKLNIGVVHVYGLTETYGPMTRTYYVDPSSPTYYRDMARQGHAFLTADDIRILRRSPSGEDVLNLDGTPQEVEPNGEEIGEICMRGNIVMSRYYRNEEATEEAFRNGYFHSGDLGVRYANGTFAIMDRAKDIIISGGENCSSLAVESALAAHPDVLEVAVVARPHSKWGERPHAFVVLKPSSSAASSPDALSAFVAVLKQFSRRTLSGFAVPEWVDVIKAEELPKTSTGKVQKVALRERVKKLPPV